MALTVENMKMSYDRVPAKNSFKYLAPLFSVCN